MKELSIEEKAKRYDEALAKAAKIHRNYKGRVRAVDVVIEEVFPELKESKDEKIKKVIYGWIYTQPSQFFDSGFSKEEMLAWLEKQGEQKPVIEMKTPEESLGIDSDTYNKIVDECVYGEQKPADVEEVNFFDDFRKTDSEVEPKFHEGEWITNGDYTWQIVEIKPLDYILQSQDGNVVDDTISHVDEQFHSFTIQDAKAGDVLVNQNGEMPFIFKECKNNHIYCYCGYTNRKDIFFDKFVDSEGEELHWLNLYHEQVYPATKEQRDLLFSKMKEAGYEWDTDKKELKKIEQKLAWSEEDERIYMSIMYSFAHNYPLTIQQQEFVKSIKERVQLQSKQEWTEEDELIIKRIKSLLYSINENDFKDIYAWLEFLKNRVQPKQEWSEEDKEVINLLLELIYEQDKMSPRIPSNEKRKMMLSWLKSLIPQITWKPSNEQMEALWSATEKYLESDNENVRTLRGEVLESLYKDLKKLREE